MKEFEIIYNQLLKYGKRLLFEKSSIFNEYDLVNEAFIRCKPDSDLVAYKKTIKNIFFEYKRTNASIKQVGGFKTKHSTRCCTSCGEEQPVSAFRIRVEVRNGTFNYLNNTCRDCDEKLARIYYSQVKNREEFKIKNRRRVREHYWETRDDRLKYEVERKKTPEYKEYMRQYRIKNAEKIKEQTRERGRIWMQKQRMKMRSEKIAA